MEGPSRCSAEEGGLTLLTVKHELKNGEYCQKEGGASRKRGRGGDVYEKSYVGGGKEVCGGQGPFGVLSK